MLQPLKSLTVMSQWNNHLHLNTMISIDDSGETQGLFGCYFLEQTTTFWMENFSVFSKNQCMEMLTLELKEMGKIFLMFCQFMRTSDEVIFMPMNRANKCTVKSYYKSVVIYLFFSNPKPALFIPFLFLFNLLSCFYLSEQSGLLLNDC